MALKQDLFYVGTYKIVIVENKLISSIYLSRVTKLTALTEFRDTVPVNAVLTQFL